MQTDLETNGTGTVFPTNVRQMGTADDGLRIYMEDYVHTYLYQYARSSANGEKLAVLMGKHLVVDGKDTVFISGVVQAKFTEKLKGMETITGQSWKYISEEAGKIFFRPGDSRLDAFQTVIRSLCNIKGRGLS